MITITPANADIEKKVRSLKILNGFVEAGFEERKAFVQVCLDECEDLNNYQGISKLNNFWALREFSLNDKLEKVLDNLKQS